MLSGRWTPLQGDLAPGVVFSGRLIALGLAPSLLAPVAYVEVETAVGDMAVLMAVSLVGYMVFAFVIAGARWAATGRQLHVIPLGGVVVVGLVGGLAQFGASYALWQWVGFYALTPQEAMMRALMSVLLGIAFATVAGSMLQAMVSFAEARAAWVARLAATQAERIRTDARGAELREIVNELVREQVSRAVGVVAAHVIEAEDSDVPGALRAAAGSIEHPRELAPAAPVKSNSLVMWLALRTQLALVAWLVLLWAVAAVPLLVVPRIGIALVSVGILGAIGVAGGYLLVVRGLGCDARRRSAPAILGAGILAVVATATAMAVLRVQSFAASLADAVFLGLWLVFLTALLAVTVGLSVREAELLAVLRARVDDEQAELLARGAVEAELRRQASILLHSQVQGRMFGVAAAVEVDPALGAWGWLVGELDGLPRQLPARTTVDLAGELKDRRGRWEGLLALTWSLPPGAVASDDSVRILDIVDEAVANAYRHGGARHVDVDVTAEPMCWSLNVTSDGAPLDAQPARRMGMGLALIGELTGGAWSLSQVESHVRLHARIRRAVR